jgi:Rad52/22 family double-strand break repair protein
MNNVVEFQQPQPAPAGLRSINEIIRDLSKPVAPRHLKQRKASNKSNEMLTYLPWFQAVRYLDLYAAGWSYSIASIQQIGDNLVMTVRITIPASEGLVSREASALEVIEDPKRYGDAATNCESAALRRAAAKFGLCLSLYDK